MKNFSKNFFFSKKNLCHFLIPGENWGEKKIFSCLDFVPGFSTILGPKKYLAFQRGDGWGRKINENH